MGWGLTFLFLAQQCYTSKHEREISLYQIESRMAKALNFYASEHKLHISGTVLCARDYQ